MSANGDDSAETRLGLAVTAGAAVGAVVGVAFLDDVTGGVVAGVVAGTVVAAAFPSWADRAVDRVTAALDA